MSQEATPLHLRKGHERRLLLGHPWVFSNEIASDLAHQYVLSYYPAPEHRDGKLHVIDIGLRSRKDIRVRARKGYYAPKPGPSDEW